MAHRGVGKTARLRDEGQYPYQPPTLSLRLMVTYQGSPLSDARIRPWCWCSKRRLGRILFVIELQELRCRCIGVHRIECLCDVEHEDSIDWGF